MKCPPAISAALKRLWPFASPADGQPLIQTNADACHSAQIMRPMPSPAETPQSPLRGLPMTSRARAWKAVRHLDENAAKRRAVIEENRKALHLTLAKGVCSDAHD